MQADAPDRHRQSDALDPARAGALNATLGRGGPVAPGDPLPPFYHQVYFWTPEPTGRLGRDGHPRVGGIIPDLGLPRRMWAGGRLAFHAPLIAGRRADRVTLCESHVRKEGRSGPLGFVTLRHEISQGGALRVTEWQDLVYRADPAPGDLRPVPPVAPTDEDHGRTLEVTSTLLFRYSALTFNGHRIHYDETYAREVEGYDGLVVHGPLLAQLMMLEAEAALGGLARFRFRATAPLLHTERATLCRKGATLWIRGPDGRLCMEAKAG